MELKDILLKKEELPILYGSCFQIPLHPKLLNSNVHIKTGIAENCFNELLKDWKKDNELINYYKENNLDINIEKNPGWHCLTREEENGLITYFSISRDFGGGIHFNEEDSNCGTSFSPYIKFSKEKEIEFKKDRKFLVYAQDNVDHYPGALFLRNWGIRYMNEVFKDVFQ